ncbi:MAG: hypothetical protein WC178_01130 [Candidatus Paceibacterota bacterium]
MMNIFEVFSSGIMLIYLGLFLFFTIALILKIKERIKEKKNDKYKDVEK